MTELIIATRNKHKVQEIRAVLPRTYSFRTLQDFPNAPIVIEDRDSFAGNATKKAVELACWLQSHQDLLAPGLRPGDSRENPLAPAKDAIRTAAIEAREPHLDREPSPECYCLADDSGLEVDALDGAPGVHSARFAALDSGADGNSTDSANIIKMLHLLRFVPAAQRTARFHCVVALTPVVANPSVNHSTVCDADEGELRTELFHGVCEGRILEVARGSGGFGYDPLFVPRGYDLTFGELNEEIKNRISHRANALAELSRALSRTR